MNETESIKQKDVTKNSKIIFRAELKIKITQNTFFFFN